ncbi:MAG: asparagine--tRNA ligase [Candidatus Rehaiarchaeum fermentans]|nr:asparagine--tRNA ligase [Candidatus Rehaiarchaeum fermentans]
MSGIKEALEGKNTTIRAWIHRKRSSGGVIFLILRDRDGLIQAVAHKENLSEEEWNELEKVRIESSVEIEGEVRKNEKALNNIEIEIKKFKIISNAEPYPITEYQSTELLLDYRHLWLRSERMINIMKIRSYVFKLAREYLDSQGFFEITPPIITKAGGETGSQLFEIKYFDEKAYLTESSQLYAEAMAFALEKVYSFAPSFRAEKSRTVKHLAEYWHLEPEALFYDLNKLMELEENLVSYIANGLVKLASKELEMLGVNKDYLLKINPPFKRITYEEALNIINQKRPEKQLKWGDDFGVEEERLLTMEEEKPIFITYWPKEIKPFYMPINEKDPRTVVCVDMQAPHGHGEIIGGSERIWKYDELIERFKETEKSQGIKFNMENYSWYLDLRKFGSAPHAGFGMGIERLIKWLLNLENIRDAIPFPRTINRVKP